MKQTVIRYLFLSTLVLLLVSLSVSQTVEVEPRDNVTLSCTNVSSSPTLAFWMRAGHTSKPIIISSVYGAFYEKGRQSDGIQQSRFVMEYSLSFINLTIMKVNSSDSGWYYCMFYKGSDVVIANSTLLLVHENCTFHEEDDTNSEKTHPVKCDGNWIMVGGIFGSVIVTLFLVIVGLVLKITQQSQLHKDTNNQPQLQESQDQESDPAEICYSMLSFSKKNRSGPRSKNLEMAVVYAATR